LPPRWCRASASIGVSSLLWEKPFFFFPPSASPAAVRPPAPRASLALFSAFGENWGFAARAFLHFSFEDSCAITPPAVSSLLGGRARPHPAPVPGLFPLFGSFFFFRICSVNFGVPRFGLTWALSPLFLGCSGVTQASWPGPFPGFFFFLSPSISAEDAHPCAVPHPPLFF